MLLLVARLHTPGYRGLEGDDDAMDDERHSKLQSGDHAVEPVGDSKKTRQDVKDKDSPEPSGD